MKIAVFDVCGTLYEVNTTFDFLDFYLKENRKYVLLRKVSQSLPGKVGWHVVSRLVKVDLLRLLVTRFLKKQSYTDLDEAAREYVYEKLETKRQFEVIDLIAKYRDEGFSIVLMSGSYNFIVKHVCARFEADDYSASELEMDHSSCTGRYKFDQLLSKRETLLEKYPEITELNVVSDNLNDLHLMEMANNGYAICNKAKQERFWRSKDLANVTVMKRYA